MATRGAIDAFGSMLCKRFESHSEPVDPAESEPNGTDVLVG